MRAHRPDRPTGSMAAVRKLLPYLWPAGEWHLRMRVVLALACLMAAKVATVYVPIFYKDAVEALDANAGLPLILPVGLILAYGTARVLSLAFAELRDAIFARVGQRAMRRVALEVFRHLHSLSLRFHLERQTGGLSRSIERGTNAIDSLLRYMLFNILPTAFEIALVFVILWSMLNIWFALATIVTVVAYIAYTLSVTEWRIKFRRRMNEQDTRANSRAIDSLLNYETVKYFGNERHEEQRFDEALQSYERAAVRSASSLSLLNIGQAAIISAGLTLVMYMAARGIVDGRMSLGDFVLVNTYLLQLYQPLGIFGWVYREIKQSLVDMERMFELLTVEREVADAPGARPLHIDGGEVRFEHVDFGYDPRRPILKDVSFTVPAGHTVAIVGPSGQASRRSAGCCFASTTLTAGASRSTGRTSARRRRSRYVPRSASFRRTRCSSTTRSATTSPTADRTQARRRSRTPRASPGSATSSRRCPTAGTPWSGSAA